MSNYILAKCSPPGEHFEQLVVAVKLTEELVQRLAQLHQLFLQIHKSDESIYGISMWFGDADYYVDGCNLPQLVDVQYKKYKRLPPKLGDVVRTECDMLIATQMGVNFTACRKHEDAAAHESELILWTDLGV